MYRFPGASESMNVKDSIRGQYESGRNYVIRISLLLIHPCKLVSHLQMIIFLCSRKQSVLDKEEKEEKTGYCSYRSIQSKVSAKESENIGHVPHCMRFGVIQRFARSKELSIEIIKL